MKLQPSAQRTKACCIDGIAVTNYRTLKNSILILETLYGCRCTLYTQSVINNWMVLKSISFKSEIMWPFFHNLFFYFLGWMKNLPNNALKTRKFVSSLRKMTETFGKFFIRHFIFLFCLKKTNSCRCSNVQNRIRMSYLVENWCAHRNWSIIHIKMIII